MTLTCIEVTEASLNLSEHAETPETESDDSRGRETTVHTMEGLRLIRNLLVYMLNDAGADDNASIFIFFHFGRIYVTYAILQHEAVRANFALEKLIKVRSISQSFVVDLYSPMQVVWRKRELSQSRVKRISEEHKIVLVSSRRTS